jgi:hypothetical protein
MISMFREAGETDKDGNRFEGPLSIRRILACFFAVSSIVLFVVAIFFAPQYGWVSYIPGGACLLSALVLLLFTTWGDISALAAVWKGK